MGLGLSHLLLSRRHYLGRMVAGGHRCLNVFADHLGHVDLLKWPCPLFSYFLMAGSE